MTDNAPAPGETPAPPSAGRLPRPEWVYLALALPFGLALVFLTPPFQVADEEAHFRRSFELSQGHVVPVKQGDYTGDFLPQGIEAPWRQTFQRLCAHPEEKTSAAEIRAAVDLRFSPGEGEFVAFANTAVHTPLTYLPQAVAILVTRQFSASVLVCLYAGRCLNFLAATAVVFLAIRLTPVVRWAFVALALTPMALFQSASVSSDALTNALAFLLVAQALACACGPAERVSWRSVGLLAANGLAVGLAKQMYFLLPVTYLLIPARKFASRGRYLAGFAVVSGATLVPVAAWSFVVRDVYSRPDFRYGADPGEQLRRMATERAEFLRTLQGTVLRTPTYAEEYLGFLGWLDTHLPAWVYLAEGLLLVAVSLLERGPAVTGRQALVALATALAVTLAVFLIIHVTWDPIATPYIVVQGRYFVPVGPLLAVALNYFGGWLPTGWRPARAVLPAVVPAAVVVFLSVTLGRVYDRYYVDSDVARAERSYQHGRALLEKAETADEGYRLLEETLRVDPDHPGAHYLLGVHLRKARPGAAAEHFRAALRRQPDHVGTLKQLGGVLAEQMDFPAAIATFEQGLLLRPDDADLKRYLRSASDEQKELTGFLQGFARTVEMMARAKEVERRYAGTPRDGLYLKPNRGRMEFPSGQPPGPAAYWRCPPPSGREICLAGPGAGGRQPFYACSAAPLGPKRVFVFPVPVAAALLADEEVSWYYQRPLADLTDAERGEEQRFRTERGLHFPLTSLPD